MEVYLDNSSTTYTDPEVLEAMLPYFTEKYGNPHSGHTQGKTALIAVDESRETISKILNCRESEIIFTGTGTESNNIAILGYARANKDKGKHIITCGLEHSSVIQPFKHLEKEGFSATFLQPNSEGFITPEQVEEAITSETILVSIQYASNEIGTIQPIAEIGKILQEKEITFHTDACQAGAYLPLNIKELNCNLLTLNGSKLYGPKGIGTLYIKRGINLEPISFGGTHEQGLRSGTLNVPGIVGLAKALEIAQEKREKEVPRLTNLRDTFFETIKTALPEIKRNSPSENCLPNNLNIQIPTIIAAELLLHLDNVGIACSASSACNTGKDNPSHVLISIGLSKPGVLSSLRFTLGRNTTEEEMSYAAEKLIEITQKLLEK